jgi:hypothetical protein
MIFCLLAINQTSGNCTQNDTTKKCGVVSSASAAIVFNCCGIGVDGLLWGFCGALVVFFVGCLGGVFWGDV